LWFIEYDLHDPPACASRFEISPRLKIESSNEISSRAGMMEPDVSAVNQKPNREFYPFII